MFTFTCLKPRIRSPVKMQKDIFITVDICNVYYKKLVRCFDSDSPTSIYSGPLGRKRCEILLGVHDKTVCNPKVQFLLCITPLQWIPSEMRSRGWRLHTALIDVYGSMYSLRLTAWVVVTHVYRVGWNWLNFGILNFRMLHLQPSHRDNTSTCQIWPKCC